MEKQRPDALLSDISIGADDGIELCRKLRSRYPDLPIALMTGDPEQVQRAREAGFDRPLIKPFAIEELRLVIERLLKKS